MSFLRRHRFGFPYVLKSSGFNTEDPPDFPAFDPVGISIITIVPPSPPLFVYTGVTFADNYETTLTARSPSAPYITTANTNLGNGTFRHQHDINLVDAFNALRIVDVPPQPYINFWPYFWPNHLDPETYPIPTSCSITIRKYTTTSEILYGPTNIPISSIPPASWVNPAANVSPSTTYFSIDPFALARGRPSSEWLIFPD